MNETVTSIQLRSSVPAHSRKQRGKERGEGGREGGRKGRKGEGGWSEGGRKGWREERGREGGRKGRKGGEVGCDGVRGEKGHRHNFVAPM